MSKQVFSVDWFQYFCHNVGHVKLELNTYFQGGIYPQTGKELLYQVKAGQESHALYRESFTIFCGNKSLVHIFMTPKMSALDHKSVSVKVANRLLYKRDWSWILHDIIRVLGFRIINITRLDLCCDFQTFDYKLWCKEDGTQAAISEQNPTEQRVKELAAEGITSHNMTPNEFIYRYLQDHHSETSETFVREGSNQFVVYGAKRARAVDGSKEINDATEIKLSSTFEYIRWGSRDSGVCTYLYNKSKELRDKKSKPWIRQRWQEAGLKEDDGDIFRIEFSIKAKGLFLKKADLKHGMKRLKADEIKTLSASDIETQKRLEETFGSYSWKYFSFRRAAGQKYRKDMKRVQLFRPQLEPTLLPTSYCSSPSVGKSEYNAGLALQRLQWTAYELSPQKQQILFQASALLKSLGVEIRQLHDRDIAHNADWEKLYGADKLNPQQRRIIDNYIEAKLAPIQRLLKLSSVQRFLDEEEALLSISEEEILFWYSKEGRKVQNEMWRAEVDEDVFFSASEDDLVFLNQ